MINYAKLFLIAHGLLGVMGCQAADLPWLPRTKEHFKCHFKDGSYVEYKHLVKWFPYAEVIPHAQTTADWKSVVYYKEPGKRRKESDLSVQYGCEGVGKENGRLLYWNGYQDRSGKDISFAYNRRPRDPGCTVDDRDPLLVAKGLAESMFCGSNWMMREFAPGEIIAETPVRAMGNSERYPVYGVIHFVFRSRYNPASDLWGEVELSDMGKIYEIGKTQSEQSWAAKYECLEDRPRGGCK